jgi:glutamine phosphoribosylpyrophosphate amidotransferase
VVVVVVPGVPVAVGHMRHGTDGEAIMRERQPFAIRVYQMAPELPPG